MPLLVFDLDGTLVDSQRDLADSANELLVSYGAAPLAREAVAAMVGDGARVLVDRIFTASRVEPNAAALEEFLAIYGRRLTRHTRFYPTVLETLASLSSGATLAILTNKPERLTQELLAHFGAGTLFTWVVGGDSGFPRKPDPAGLLHIVGEWARLETEGASRTSRGKDRVLFVGDSRVDLETGRRAGVTTCLAAYGFGRLRGDLSDQSADLVASRPEDLATVLHEFMR